ncbi:hypothetical protein WCLP8_3840008 [uncultured Gammaproteobacteria bacterium]
MQPDQQPLTTLVRHPLELVLGVDVNVGWRLSVATSPGKLSPQHSLEVFDADDINSEFENENSDLLDRTRYANDLAETFIRDVPVWLKEFGKEFEVPGFGRSFHYYTECLDCVDLPECELCGKTGKITHTCRSYLVAVCSVNKVVPRLPSPFPPAEGNPPPAPPQPTPPRTLKKGHWAVAAAALATIIMAVSVALRVMLYPELIVQPAPSTQTQCFPAENVPAPAVAAPPPLEPTPAPPPLAESDSTPPDPLRKPVAPPEWTPPLAEGPEKNAPGLRLQRALSELGFHHGPLTGELDGPTRLALAEFLALVPQPIKSKFGKQVAAMAEAAARHDFNLDAKPGSGPPVRPPLPD